MKRIHFGVGPTVRSGRCLRRPFHTWRSPHAG